MKLNILISVLGALLIIVAYILFTRILHRKKIKRIIENHKEKHAIGERPESTGAKTEGWSMNNTPFRKRKSGLSWGGGNIHAANASRGERRSFMKR